MPIEPGPHGPPVGWWTVKRNGLPVRHFPDKKAAVRDRPGIQGESSRRKGLGEGEGEMTGRRPAGRPWTRAEDDQLRAMLEAGVKAPRKRTVSAVCTENLIRVDDVMESPKLA